VRGQVVPHKVEGIPLPRIGRLGKRRPVGGGWDGDCQSKTTRRKGRLLRPSQAQPSLSPEQRPYHAGFWLPTQASGSLLRVFRPLQAMKHRTRSRHDSAPRTDLDPSTPHLSNGSGARGRRRPEVVSNGDPLTPDPQTQTSAVRHACFFEHHWRGTWHCYRTSTTSPG